MSDDNLIEIIIRQVLDEHGEIEGFKDITAGNVFENRWRVNIWITYQNPELISGSKSQRIEYSYFMHVDDAGNITKCEPPLGEKVVLLKSNRGLPTR
tara:strand:+ start:38 stop:328 length:291 start_codon:yes stop_codon:yes gene_type:complete